MADDLKAMSDAAAVAGAAIGVQSAYRSYDSQKSVFNTWVAAFGYERALQVSARPGHSEHQLGLAIDFRSNPADDLALDTDWAGTPAGKWMKAHAWEYGFLMSYPKGTIDVTCYDWEPWHYRYVGRELAATIHASGLTTREYLWANFTTAVVPPKAAATPKPAVTHLPSAAPTVAPTWRRPRRLRQRPPPPRQARPNRHRHRPPPSPRPAQARRRRSWPLLRAATPGLRGHRVVRARGAGALLAAVVVGLWLALRRGRSGVGL
jgi:D-alanyl-D-alanine carboxypeptidase